MSLRSFILCTLLGLVLAASAAFAGQSKSFTSDQPPFTADLHKSAGVSCVDCHGEGKKQSVDTDQCLECHKSFEKIAKKTADMTPNPHDNHLTKSSAECNQCHQGHKANENICVKCHSEMVLKRNK
ncbi:cytochrome c3 family protein [Telmatospirillum siberiense]|uniref:Tetrahaem cytochrome domain-containing protein n=1 Tax=Telmatospirillum siberiense TaxID=382514 RepID=A0A2N3Q0D6_9PROT|nr:cytochrome c3 family protein [Telmatospirillum siberiense]PKU26113.1 hypothetical protein CWS72_02985 [Telmatospirillum siberiense]